MSENAHGDYKTEIELAKLEAINDINKRVDEKLQHALRVFRFGVWSVSFSAAVLVGTLGILGYKGYKDIQDNVKEVTKENALRIIDSPEFKTQINNSIVAVVDQKINSIDDVSNKIVELKNKVDATEIKSVIHNLFSTIEPRLARLENLEKNQVLSVSDDGIYFYRDGKSIFTVQVGKIDLTSEEIRQAPINSYPGFTEKIHFKKAFKQVPQVFTSLEYAGPEDIFKPNISLGSVKVDNDGFTVSMSRMSSAKLTAYKIDNVKLGWIAIGQAE